MTQPAHARIALTDADASTASCRPAAFPRPSCPARCAGSPARRACSRAPGRRDDARPVDVLRGGRSRSRWRRPPAAPDRDGRAGDAAPCAAQPPWTQRPALSAESMQARLLERLAPGDDRARAREGARGRRRPARGRGPTRSRRWPPARVPRADVRRPARGRAGAAAARAWSTWRRTASRCWRRSPRVIEAYMVGLNHEMSRELLWREFPADSHRHAVPPVLGRSRPARRARDARDIPPIADWGGTALGTTPARSTRAASSCCSCAANCCAATRRRRSTPRPRRPTARSTRRRAWRRCSAASSHPTWCSSASR